MTSAALSRLFPEVIFTVAYADEDIGYNIGRYAIQNGEVVTADDMDEGTEEACRFAEELWATEE